MEDDDEFGDLYTDVLRPLSAASQSPHQTSPAAFTSLHRPIDLNLNLKSNDHPASAPNSTPPHTLAPAPPLPSSHAPPRADTDGEFTDNDNDVKVKFDIEEANNGISNDDDVPGIEIPGISQNGVENSERQNRNEGEVGEEAEDDWESDSEDDLQIVLNEDNHRPMLIDGGGGDDDDDEDGDPLVIVADADASNHQGLMVEEQEWGGDDAAAQMGEGGAEKKEGTGERANGAAASAATAAAAAKIGYSNHFAYHNPYHSQFKYVRPGAAPIPGSATAVAAGGPGQVRPLVNMGPAGGRGRGDWRPTGMKTAPPMQKGFHPGFGMSASGVNMAGRGLEFTLPSHKTIFDIDIDGFEEKPWKYPGVDITDFFNFGLNEESWKDYCKQLEQHRLETTMQSKIRVYESGRDQEYDPDLPPELAAATGILDVPADNTNLGKPDIGQSDLTKGPARVRPPIPTGRAIQVEGGSGERLPSIDTRPPRIRDSDAIIEIVCQDSVDDDSSAGNGDRDNDLPREDRRGENDGAEDEMGPVDTEYCDGFREAYDSRNRELVSHEAPFMNVAHDNIPERNGLLPFPPEVPIRYRPGSRGPTPKCPGENIGTSHEQRRRPGRTGDRSPRMTPSQSPQIRKFHDNQDEESVESMEGKHSPLSSPVIVRDARELSVEHTDAVHDELVLGDGSSAVEKEETNAVTTSDSRKDGKALYSLKTKKINSQVEQPELQEFDEEEDSRAARSSENSKARSGSSRDNKKWREGDEEVMQDRRSTRMGSMKKHPEENEQSFRRKDRQGRQEMERNRMVAIGREGSYPRRDLDPSLTHDMQMKPEGFDRRKERENSDGVWQRRDDEPYSRKNRIEDTRKREREHLDEIGARHRGKARESERIDRDEYLHSRKQLDNGSYRPHYDKDASSRHRERDDSLKSRYEMVDDYISKRRKDDEYVRRDHAEKDEILHGHRDLTSRRKRERDDILDQRRREDQQRIRENFDDHHPVRHKDENWSQRERGERQREREEWHRPKPHEEILSKREREEGRGAVRSGRSSEDRAWVGHARVKDEYKGSDKEYQVKDTVRHSEQLKRRERIEDESRPPHRGREDVYARGNQISNEDRKSRQERSGPRNDRSANTSDNNRVNEKKHKESSRKNRESEVGNHNSLVASKRNQEDQSGHVSEMGAKDTHEQGNCGNEKPVHGNSSRKEKEEASSDDEQQDSRRGRSKLERWTSHKERDFNANKEPATAVEPVDKQSPMADKKDGSNPENTKPVDDRHLDTVEKLKKRSERFKLPMPSEKDTLAIKKMESEPLPSTKSETAAGSEIKQERPARKRRWISN
ncbi:hypothetical protein AB3S75_021032 [Citrus x aurantiifolia]